MNGYQLTFYTEKNSRHGHQTVCEWLLHKTRELGIVGATVIHCAEGVGHAGAHHAAHGLRLNDQPLQIILAVTEQQEEQLLALVRAEGAQVFYTRAPVEFGFIGDDASSKPGKPFPLFKRN